MPNVRLSKRTIILSIIALLFLLLMTVALLFYRGILQFSHPSHEDYPIGGVDVSHHQGTINWAILAAQDIDFAFIKATEGGTFTDPQFVVNFEDARSTHLAVGVYHFFSFDSPARDQARHFINTVPAAGGMLAPVIDVESYGDYNKNTPDIEKTRQEIDVFCTLLEDYYELKPIIYTTEAYYRRYIAGHFPDHDIWIRSVYSTPSLSDGRTWTFWQYSNRIILQGYEGREEFIDLNVFHGTRVQFESYPRIP